MGFFNGILRGLGFEGEQKSQTEKVVKVKTETDTTFMGTGAKFNLEDKQKPQKKKEEKKLKDFKPCSQKEVQDAIKHLKENGAVVLDLSFFSDADLVRVLDFVSGAAFILSGRIQKTGEKNFFVCLGE